MLQPFLLLIGANLTQAGYLGWKWSLWPVLAWLAVQQSKAVFFLTLYDSINGMKYFCNFSITPQPCRLGWWYNAAKLSFFWPYMLVWMIWNTYKLSAVQLSRATDIWVVDWCQFGPSWIFGMKMELMACTALVGDTTEHGYLFTDLTW